MADVSKPHSEPDERPLHDYIDMEAYDVVAGETYRKLVEQLEAVAQAVEALWVTRIVTGETAVVNTRELTDLHKLFRDSNPARRPD